jgi:uncharacterized protein DUF6496
MTGRGKMRSKPKTKAGKAAKVEKVMHEYKTGVLRSSSKSGPKVTKRKQAVAIALSEAGKSRKR